MLQNHGGGKGAAPMILPTSRSLNFAYKSCRFLIVFNPGWPKSIENIGFINKSDAIKNSAWRHGEAMVAKDPFCL